MAKWGLKISQDGFDVNTASNKDLVFTTEGISPKVKQQDYTNVVATPVTIAHGLSYYPVFLIWKKAGGAWKLGNYDVYVTTSDLVFDETGEFFYVIYYDDM